MDLDRFRWISFFLDVQLICFFHLNRIYYAYPLSTCFMQNDLDIGMHNSINEWVIDGSTILTDFFLVTWIVWNMF